MNYLLWSSLLSFLIISADRFLNQKKAFFQAIAQEIYGRNDQKRQEAASIWPLFNRNSCFPIAHSESQTKRHREPRRETNWYFAIKVCACAWAIGKMHWASTKLKLSFYSINLYVAFTQWKNYAFLYSYSRIRWIKRTLQIKRSRLIKKSISSIHLNPKTKSISPNPGIPRDRRRYSPLYCRGIGCVRLRLNGLCNEETPHLNSK